MIFPKDHPQLELDMLEQILGKVTHSMGGQSPAQVQKRFFVWRGGWSCLWALVLALGPPIACRMQ